MKCLDCKNWNLRGSNPQMRRAGWAPCSASDFAKSKFNGEKFNGLMDRDMCWLKNGVEVVKFDQLSHDLIVGRKKYLGIEDE